MKQIADLTIIMPVFNGLPYLVEAIHSIDNSLILPQVLLVVDDGSNDQSVDYIRSLEGKSYKIRLEQINHSGMAKTLNYGLKLINTKYIMRMDSDDTLHSEKISKQYSFLEKNQNIFIVGTNAINFDENMHSLIGTTNFPLNHKDIIREYRKGDHGLLDGTTMFRNHQILKSCQYREGLSVGCETTFYLDLLVKNNVYSANLKDKLYNVRINTKSSSSRISYNEIKEKHTISRCYFNDENTLFAKYRELNDFLWFIFWRRTLTNKNKNSFKYLLYLMITIILKPSKIFSRIINYFRKNE